MKCLDCGMRMWSNGSRCKRGETMRHMRCPRCKAKVITVEKVIAVQRDKGAEMVKCRG